MRRMTACCMVVMFFLAPARRSPAATITVDQGGGGDFTGIQEALDAAGDGDLVLVRPGTYAIFETLDFNRLLPPTADGSRNLVLQSEAGPAATVIRMMKTEGTSRERA